MVNIIAYFAHVAYLFMLLITLEKGVRLHKDARCAKAFIELVWRGGGT
jgi:hypothetical protein